MKKSNLFGLVTGLALIFVFLLAVSCEKETLDTAPNTQERILDNNEDVTLVNDAYLISYEEFIELEEREKIIASFINAAISSLENISKNKIPSYIATIDLSKDLDDPFSNFMAISMVDKTDSLSKIAQSRGCSGSCTISGFSSARKCAKAIKAAVDSCGALSATIEKVSGGYKITWAEK